MSTCSATLTRAWNRCARGGVFPDGRCHLHTEHLSGSPTKRNGQLRALLKRALSVQVTDGSGEKTPAVVTENPPRVLCRTVPEPFQGAARCGTYREGAHQCERRACAKLGPFGPCHADAGSGDR
jgi:hypothetical protein